MAETQWWPSPDGTRMAAGEQPPDWDLEDLHNDRIENGECPNGCGPMEQDTPRDWTCTRCGFQYHQRTLHVGGW